ncbi:unnamed protein product [Pedinophyceae sp. YPF-701]|nr:unnamed protein product [Pedinophyceae sp. YPF-701]
MAEGLQRDPLNVEGLADPVNTSYAAGGSPETGNPPIVLLHGFDSSCLEFRRLFPLLSERTDTYAVDLIGWGFTETGHTDDGAVEGPPIGPDQKRAHLYAFWEQKLQKRKMVLVGASLGGATAIDFAVEHPEAVERLVLVDSQAFIDGVDSMWKPLAMMGLSVLQSKPLRDLANKMAYYDKERLATKDAMHVGRLHTFMPGWKEAGFAFMESQGYKISKKVSQISVPTLICWGRQDEILDPANAKRFEEEIEGSKLVWLEECGHCGHLEQPQRLAAEIFDFMSIEAAQPELAAKQS